MNFFLNLFLITNRIREVPGFTPWGAMIWVGQKFIYSPQGACTGFLPLFKGDLDFYDP